MKTSTQNKFLINAAKKIFSPKMKKNSSAKIYLPETTKEFLENKHPPIYFAGIHRSFWETTASIILINKISSKTPYILMGDNLPLKKIAKKAGVIIYPRLKDKTIEESKRVINETKELLKLHWEQNKDIIIFAGGGRTYDGIAKPFGKMGFEVAKQISEKQEIYIIPFVVDYHSFRQRELDTYIKAHLGEKGSAQHINILDWINFTEKMNSTYTRLGNPIKVDPEENSAKLANYSFEKALKLSKILPENILGLAKLQTYDSMIYKDLNSNLERILDKLNNHKELCELENEDKIWTPKQILEESITPYTQGTKEDYAWSQHFTNLVKNHYKKINLL